MAAAPPTEASSTTSPERTVAPRRGLPGGRAVAGALLVVLAAVGTFAAYLRSVEPPSTDWLVASASFRPGQVLTEQDVADGIDTAAIELPQPQAARTLPASSATDLVGTVVLAPLEPGDLLQVSAVAAPSTDQLGVSLSFALPGERAFGGRVGAGESVDLLASFDRRTAVVARDVLVADVIGNDGSVAGAGVILTVLVDDLATAQVVLNAADNGQIALTRGAAPDETSGEDVVAEGPPPPTADGRSSGTGAGADATTSEGAAGG